MSGRLADIIDLFPRLTVGVVGDAILDSYLEGTARRLSSEAPVPLVDVSDRRDMPGGAAATAASVCDLGGRATLLSVVGTDADAARLEHAVARRGVDTEHLLPRASRLTVSRHRVLAGGQLLLRYDDGDTGSIDQESEKLVVERLTTLVRRSDVVVVKDAGLGLMTPRVVASLAELAPLKEKVLLVESRHPAGYAEIRPAAFLRRQDYGVRLARRPGDPRLFAADLEREAQNLLALTHAGMVVFTLGAAGAVLFEAGGNSYRTYGQPARRPRVRAGDDAFLAAFALGLAAGADPVAAAELGTAATLVVVKQDGTIACRAQELREQLAGAAKVTSLSRLVERVETYREQGRLVVFTNGCFDILHRGHIAYLNRAKALGDVLVVGVNADQSVQRLKGPSRPINPLEDRLAVLAALSSIDHLVEFDADTPAHLIRAIRPDVFVKGGDYTRETLPEAPLVEELGAALCILPFVEDRSTTGIIARIRSRETTRTGT